MRVQERGINKMKSLITLDDGVTFFVTTLEPTELKVVSERQLTIASTPNVLIETMNNIVSINITEV